MAGCSMPGKYDEWLGLFAAECRYNVVSRENYDRGLPAALIFCDSRAMLEDRIMALREANKYNIHTDRHLIGLPRLRPRRGSGDHRSRRRSRSSRPTRRERPGCSPPASTATGSKPPGGGLKIRDKLVLLDTFAVPTLLATPL